MRQTTKQAARGKWDGIIAQLIGEQAIARKHGPCPICGGVDRYRYDNKRNDGDWYCNVCGPGDGFRLLSESLGLSFSEAAREVDKIVGNFEEQPFKPEMDVEKRRLALNSLWSRGDDPSVPARYLRSRGIPVEIIAKINDVRGVRVLPLYEGKECVGNYPTMIALIRNKKGVPISIHRTYFKHGSKEKKIMPPLESITGGCIRLGDPDDTLVLAEGAETALAAWAITGHPAWATISAHGMESFTAIPRHVKRVIIVADNDKSFTGQAAAFVCAKYMSQRAKVETIVAMPESLGLDMLDVLQNLTQKNLLVRGREDQIGILRWKP